MPSFLILPEYLDHVVVTHLLHKLINTELVVQNFLSFREIWVRNELFVLVEVNCRSIGPHCYSQAAWNSEDKGVIHCLQSTIYMVGEAV